MAYYAFLNDKNIVTEVIVGKEENELLEGVSPEQYYGNIRKQVCKRTSYNTYSGVHLLGGTPFRKNYAGIGYLYDEDKDAFIPPQDYPSWVLNETTCLWEAPVPMPADNNSYAWNEETQSWDLIDGSN